ncbi:MAG: DUF4831 family protein [Bacteroidales bacterium]|jgi:hypothetical protein|nr:DUF4831 family protein [Bacteroidales bacterium]
MKKTFFIIFFTLLFGKIFSQIQSYHVSEANIKIKDNPIFYYLPKTSLNIHFETETEYFVPGPFCKFADKYLLIKDVSIEKKTKSSIKNISISEYSIADEKNCYFVVEKNFDYKLSLTNLGILTSYNYLVANSDYEIFPQIENSNNKFDNTIPTYTDFGVKRNFTDKTDTTYKVIEVDSVFQKIPVYNQVITSKNFEQKAEEAANYIIKIRKRRFKLQSGQFENDTPPNNVTELIEELNNLEQQYTELFVGKKIIINNEFSLNYIPEQSEEITIAYLSDENGIIETKENNAKPITLKIEKVENNYKIENFYKSHNLNTQNVGLYYVNPGMADITIKFNNIEVSKTKILLPQFGFINSLPAKMFSNKNLKIIFDDKKGAIKSIF